MYQTEEGEPTPLHIQISQAFSSKQRLCDVPNSLKPFHPSLSTFPLLGNTEVLTIDPRMGTGRVIVNQEEGVDLSQPTYSDLDHYHRPLCISYLFGLMGVKKLTGLTIS